LAQFSPAHNGELNSSPDWKRVLTKKNYTAIFLLGFDLLQVVDNLPKLIPFNKKELRFHKLLYKVLFVLLCGLFPYRRLRLASAFGHPPPFHPLHRRRGDHKDIYAKKPSRRQASFPAQAASFSFGSS
jgi:hypothetical protein